MATRGTIGAAGWRAWLRARGARLPWARGLPWAVSMALHGALVLVGAALVWGVASRRALPPEPDPRNAFVEFEDPSPAHGEEGSGTKPAGAAAPGPRPADAGAAEIRERPPAVPAHETPVVLRGISTDLGGGAAEVAAPTMIEAPAPAALRGGAERVEDVVAPATGGVKFGGLGASPVRSVAYVVDGSGPMVTSLPGVLEELKRSVAHLSSSQFFAVIIFRDGGDPSRAYDAFMPVLVRATPGAKERLGRWLGGVQAGGSSNPLDGLRAAVALRPEAVFLLSRSIERSGGGVWQMEKGPLMAELDRLNPVDARNGLRRIVIKTIQFLDEDPTGIMQEVGRVHGSGGAGKGDAGYRVVREGSELAK